MYFAIENENVEIVKLLLLNDKLDINVINIIGNFDDKTTALHLAMHINNSEIGKLLLEKKDIDINIEDFQGKKPIDYAKNDEIKQLLSK